MEMGYTKKRKKLADKDQLCSFGIAGHKVWSPETALVADTLRKPELASNLDVYSEVHYPDGACHRILSQHKGTVSFPHWPGSGLMFLEAVLIFLKNKKDKRWDPVARLLLRQKC